MTLQEYPAAMAPLGPIDQYDHWVRTRPDRHNTGGDWTIDATYFTDKYRNEYNSVEHVARCAIAKELGI